MSNPIRVLFVCTGNAARSQMAEALLRHTDASHFQAFSAGTVPAGVDDRALDALRHAGVSTAGLRSKSLDEVRGQRFDCIVRLCAKAAGECHTLATQDGQTQPLTWDFADPAEMPGTDAFRHMLHELHERIKMLVLIKTKPRAAARHVGTVPAATKPLRIA
jgi:ArsR family transcriptional regulator, arsenate/arsenite/antimonite-responsive transcriptional repressor / arsenate reductase (thioredoxin)